MMAALPLGFEFELLRDFSKFLSFLSFDHFVQQAKQFYSLLELVEDYFCYCYTFDNDFSKSQAFYVLVFESMPMILYYPKF